MLGRALLVVALGFAAYAAVAAPASMRRRAGGWVLARPELLASARRATIATAVAVSGASLLLWYALFTRDFSLEYVARSTERAAQPWYVFSSFWSGMAGSLLLWSLILSVFVAVFATRRGAAGSFVPFAIPVLAGAQIFFLAITAGPENPFARSDIVPLDGRGLNPLLHSPGMVIHPPLLYIGLVGLTVPFAVVVSALITGRTGADWLLVVRRWTLGPWLALGAGLVLGGAWAYTELGWGGYWGWDPVENAALMPWLAATAFLHSAVVQERRGMLKVWNVFLVTLAAVLSTFGTFLTRSGLISSVHTFAESPIGRWFFVFLAIQATLGIGLLVWRLPDLRAEHSLGSALSKESLFLVNNLLLVGAVGVVLWGTVLPLVTEALLGSQIAVGPPFFNRVLSPLGAALLLVASVGSVVPWRRGTVGRVAVRLRWPAAWAVAAAAIALVVTRSGAFAGLVALAGLMTATSVIEVVRAVAARRRLTGTGVLESAIRTTSRSPRRVGGYIVHAGVALMVVGFAGSLFTTQTDMVVEPGQRRSFAGYTFTFEDVRAFDAPDKRINIATVGLARGGDHLATLRPQLNFHTDWEQPQSEIAIRSTPLDDVYVILVAVSADHVVLRVHHNPLVAVVWFGAAVAVAGGALALVMGGRARRPTALEPERVPA